MLKKLFIVLLFLCFYKPLISEAQESSQYYVYHGQRVPLELDGNSIAIRHGIAKSINRQLSQAKAMGVAATSARLIGIDRWSVLDLQTPMIDEHETRDRIQKLTATEDVEFVSPVFRSDNGSPIILTRDIMVRFKPQHVGTAQTLLKTITPELLVLEENYGGMYGAYKLRSKSRNGFDVLASANRLAEGGYTEWAEPDMIVTGSHELIPNDPLFPQQWGIHNTGQFAGVAGMDMKGDLAWNITTGDSAVKVMVIDCGVQQNHPDLHQISGLDFTGQGGGGGPVNSCDNHGTMVAGCVSASINNGIGVAGIAPNCYVISARTLVANNSCNNTFTGQISWTINALAYAASHGIRITNFSNQYFTGPSSALEAEYQTTHNNNGMVHFSAAGNGSTAVYYPASIPVVNAVGALNSKGVLASFSNFGSAIDFTAPGDSIYTTDRTGSAGFSSNDYVRYRGSSFASPYAAGVAALILSQNPSFTTQQVEAKMKSSSVDLGSSGYDTLYGWGFVNAYNAVRSSCILTPPSNITVPVDPNQCGAIVNFPSPTTSGNCGPVTCVPPSGSFFTAGTTTVVCTDTSGDQCVFTVTVTGGSYATGILRDDFNRSNGTLAGTNKWSLILNQPSSGSMSIINNAIQPTSSAGNYNFGGVVWDSLVGPGTEMSVTVGQKSGDFNNTSLFIYARMNNKDYNTGTGYRLRYLEQSGTDNFQIQRVGPGYSNSVVLATASFEINPGDVITFRVLCNNQTMVVLVNGNQVISVTDAAYTPAQWYYAIRSCVLPTPFRLDNFKISPQQSSGSPLLPTLLSPATGTLNQPVASTLSWNTSAGATSYRIQVATDSLFGTIVLDDSTVAGTSKQTGLLANNTKYYWRVNAKNSSGTSGYSTIWNFTTVVASPLSPVLQFPATGSVNQPTTLTLSWIASVGASTYRVQIATDSLFVTKILDDSTITGTSKQTGLLANNTTYYWRVNAKNAGGTSPFSTIWNFGTIPAFPLPPTLLSPSNGSINQSINLTLNWNAASGASTYRVQVSIDSLFSTIVSDDSMVVGTTKQINSLGFSTTYYWRVNSKNSAGTSPYSIVWNFTTSAAPIQPPAIPVLLSPANGATDESINPTLSWNSSPTATTYRVQVSTDSLFNTIIVDDSILSTTLKQVGPLSGGVKYYWRVSASNSGGTNGFSASWNFVTIALPPGTPTLLAPVNNAVNQPTSLTLTWTASVTATSYRVQVSTDSLFGVLVADDSTVTSALKQLNSLTNSTIYFWRVRAKNANGISEFSPAWNFLTIIATPSIPTQALPLNGSTGQPVTLTISWNSSVGAATYRLQLAADSLFAAMILDDSTLTVTSKQVGPLNNNAKYFWRVNAKNIGGVSSYSTVWNFTTILLPPSAPLLASPANGATCQSTTLTLSWSASSGAASYRVQVATDPSFLSIILDDSTVATPSRQIVSLTGGRTYYWHVSAKNAGGESAYSASRAFTTFTSATLRDNFNRTDGSIAGSNKWASILNHPSSGAMNIVNNAIQPYSSAGNTNFGGVVWDSLMGAGSEVTLTMLQKGSNYIYTSLFIYAKMNNKDYNTGTGYRLRYFEQSGTDILEIHRVGPGYPNSVTIASKSQEINIGDKITFRVMCDNKTLVALVNGVQAMSVVDSVYMPSQWYFAVRGCVFPTPIRFDDFSISTPPSISAQTRSLIQSEQRPSNFVLEQNYPDPFNPTTTIRYGLPGQAYVNLKIYNVLGQEIKTLVDEVQDAGIKFVEWNSTNTGTEIPSGVYFYRLSAQQLSDEHRSFSQVKKMLLVK